LNSNYIAIYIHIGGIIEKKNNLKKYPIISVLYIRIKVYGLWMHKPKTVLIKHV